MYRVLDCLTTQHDPWLVLIAVLLCLGGVHTAFNLYSRACVGRLQQKLSWLFLTGVVTGCAIWATHFVAMLAYDPVLPVGYNPGLTILSLLIAIVATFIGFTIPGIAKQNLVPARLVGGLVVGLGISAMHFTGMAAMRVPGVISWHMDIVVAAILMGAAFGMVTLLIAGKAQTGREKTYGKIGLTVAIVTMHFSAMGALIITPDPTIPVPAQIISQSSLALAVAMVATLVIGIGFVMAMIDRQLRENASARMRIFGDSAIEALVMTQNGIIVDANHSFLKMIKGETATISGVDFIETWLPDASPAFRDGAEHYTETSLALSPGHTIPVEVIRRDLPADEFSEDAVIYALRDLRERYEAERHIRYLAEHDALTKLLNRATFHDRLALALEQSRVTGNPVSVLCIDLDHFKELNDTYGHIAGDHALREVGERIGKLIEDNVIFARVGGDEFVALIVHDNPDPDSMIATAQNKAQALLDCLSVPVFINPGNSARIAASVGIAHFPDDGDDIESIMFHADLAMYRVKQGGGNHLVFFSPEMDDEYRYKRQLSGALRHAMDENALELHYQPQCNAHSSKIIGFEALLRWHHPELGQVPPSRFIPIAEETGLINPLGEWVMRKACAEAVTWTNPLGIAVNLSAVQLQNLDLAQTVAGILDETGLAPERLELEITETALIHNASRSRKILTEIKALGVRIAMDDFGTGYSSLATLQNFPVDRIKIDQSFIARLMASEQAVAIVRAVINLGRDLKLEVIAEGVETEDQVAFLTANDCDAVQGYKFGHPRPIADYQTTVSGTAVAAQHRSIAGIGSN